MEQRPCLNILSETVDGSASFDAAISHALLRRVAAGELEACLRLYRPPDAVVFSQLDRLEPGFAHAVAHARNSGFDAAVRLAGGRAAVFHARTLAFAWTTPVADSRLGIRQRFRETAEWIARALRRLDVDARVGEVAGEYCPGEFSVNAAGRRKLAGIAQRVVRGAAHVGGVIVLGESRRIVRVLAPVYREFALVFEPGSVGSLDEERGHPCEIATLRDSLIESLPDTRRPVAATIDDDTFRLARELEPRHRVD